MVYLDQFQFKHHLKKQIPYIYSRKACFYHYWHMAFRNKKAYFQGDKVSAKKYFYVLRPIFACQWIERSVKPVPMLYEVLIKNLIKDKKSKLEIDRLLENKKSGYEFEKGPKYKVLDDFIEKEMVRLESVRIPEDLNKNKGKRLDSLFRKILIEVWTRKA